jgi:hypothetical protein
MCLKECSAISRIVFINKYAMCLKCPSVTAEELFCYAIDRLNDKGKKVIEDRAANQRSGKEEMK